jgi:hypothetical protein
MCNLRISTSSKLRQQGHVAQSENNKCVGKNTLRTSKLGPTLHADLTE